MAAPFPTGAGAEALVPTIFSKKLQSKFYAQSVMPLVSNTDYEGEISGQGDKVVIRTVPNITVSDYTDANITYPNVESGTIELLIDKAKFYSFKVDDIQRAQSDIAYWTEASKDASESMRIAVETDFLANVVTGATSVINTGGDNSSGTGTAATSSSVLEDILHAGTLLDELNIPESGRFVVLPPWAWELLKLSDLKAVHVSGDGTSPLRNGEVGMIDRFKVLKSNMLYTHTTASEVDTGKTYCLAGHPKFATFASQFVKTETLRLESRFGDGVRGLKVYGYKVVTPDCGVNIKLLPASAVS